MAISNPVQYPIYGEFVMLLLFAAMLSQSGCVRTQSVPPVKREPDQSWVGQRIIMLTGFGEVRAPSQDGRARLRRVPNIVAPVARIEGDQVWIVAPGGVDPTGWIDKGNALLLEDAVPYFTSLIERNPIDWDAYFRRAEAHHALNQRDEAIDDYTTAIQLHRNDAYLYLRRARSFHARKACNKALADYDEVIRLDQNFAAEAYSVKASIYTKCPDSLYQDPQKAIAAAEHAIAMDKERPTYLTILAAAYARAVRFEEAVMMQKQALESPQFPPGYREEAERYLHQLEQALATQKIRKP